MPMITAGANRFKNFTLLSMASLHVAIAILGIWFYAFQTGENQQERVQNFLSYFPSFLGLWGITAIQIGLSTGAIVISSICLRLTHNGWKLMNIAVIAGGSLMVLLNIWWQL